MCTLKAFLLLVNSKNFAISINKRVCDFNENSVEPKGVNAALDQGSVRHVLKRGEHAVSPRTHTTKRIHTNTHIYIPSMPLFIHKSTALLFIATADK